MQSRKPPKLSKEALMWDKRFPSPQKEKQGKKVVMPYVTQRCFECDGLTHEDRASGDNVCMDCGLCERLIIQDETSYLDVFWSRISVTTKSQHVLERYMLDLMRKFKISKLTHGA